MKDSISKLLLVFLCLLPAFLIAEDLERSAYYVSQDGSLYSISKHLGSGSFGSVFSSIMSNARTKSRNLAIKFFNSDSENIINRYRIIDHGYLNLKKSNLLGYKLALFQKSDQYGNALSPDKEHVLLSDVYEGSLNEIEGALNIRSGGSQKQVDMLHQIMEKMLLSLKELSHHDLLHSDIKPDNILYKNFNLSSNKIEVVLADFDFLDEPGKSYSGTPETLSPEYFRRESLTIASDLFSLGATMYRLAFGEFPLIHEESNNKKPIYISKSYYLQKYKKISQTIFASLHDKKYGANQVQFRKFLMASLKLDPDKRVTSFIRSFPDHPLSASYRAKLKRNPNLFINPNLMTRLCTHIKNAAKKDTYMKIWDLLRPISR